MATVLKFRIKKSEHRKTGTTLIFTRSSLQLRCKLKFHSHFYPSSLHIFVTPSLEAGAKTARRQIVVAQTAIRKSTRTYW